MNLRKNDIISGLAGLVLLVTLTGNSCSEKNSPERHVYVDYLEEPAQESQVPQPQPKNNIPKPSPQKPYLTCRPGWEPVRVRRPKIDRTQASVDRFYKSVGDPHDPPIYKLTRDEAMIVTEIYNLSPEEQEKLIAGPEAERFRDEILRRYSPEGPNNKIDKNKKIIAENLETQDWLFLAYLTGKLSSD